MNRVPFNTETFLGFYLESFVQMFTVHFYMLIFSSIYSLFNAFHSFTDALNLDYTMASESINELLLEKRQNRKIQIKQFLRDSIRLHVGLIR